MSETPISELLREVVDRIERGEFKGKAEPELSDLYGLRVSLLFHIPRVEEIERADPDAGKRAGECEF